MGINALRSAIRLALSTGAGAGVLGVAAFVPGAQAQDIGARARADEITVTGSAIPRADLSSASPITVLNREEMLATGIRDVGDLLQRMPSMSGSPIGTTTNNGGTGSVEIDLRGMGVDRTVTLVNGHRLVDGGDYQTIPPIMIERVEILKDGASAIYGADAVAGVVNIITRTDFDGISVDFQNADFFDMDSGSMNTVSVIAGTTFDTGNFVFGAEYVDQEEAYQRDAPWEFFQNSYYIYPGPNQGCEAHPTLPYTGTPEGGCYVLGSSRIEEGRFRFPTHGQRMVMPGGALVPWDFRLYNYAPVNYIQTPYQRTNVFAEANFDLTDSVRFSASLRGNFRESAQELAPQPYSSEVDPGYPVVIGGATYQGISQDNYYLVQAVTAAGLAPEPVQNARRRMSELPRTFTQDVTQYEARFQLSGDIGNVGWEAYYNTGRRDRVDQDYGQFSGPRLYNALGPSADLDGNGIPECYRDINDPTSLIAGCVPLNLFAGPRAVPADQLAYVGINLVDNRLTEQSIVGITLNGTAFDLPGGQLGWAVGVNYWGQTFLYSPDSAKQLDEVTGNTGLGTDGSLYSMGLFAEMLAPLAESFNLKLGVRNDDYNKFGGETTYQIGLEFQAAEGLKLRATSSSVFRAPTIEDLYEGTQDDFPTYSDPCIPSPPGGPLPPGCAQLGVQFDQQLLARVGGNPNLIPETGDTLTAGIVWTPNFSDGDLSLTIDYWTVDIEDGISSLGVQYILDTCYEEQNAQSCALVFRAPDYSIDHVIDASLNVASQGAEGVDTELRYTFDTGSGQLQLAFLWSHLLERTKVPYPGAPEQDLSARYTDITAEDGGAYAQDKINYSLQWQINNLTIGYLGEYISALDADTFCNCGPVQPYIQKIDSYLYHDVVIGYEFGMGSQISFGATDITDEEPPFIEIGFNALTDPSTYRMFGRGYYLRFTQNFE